VATFWVGALQHLSDGRQRLTDVYLDLLQEEILDLGELGVLVGGEEELLIETHSADCHVISVWIPHLRDQATQVPVEQMNHGRRVPLGDDSIW
jgi:hypothetical protein